MQRKLHISPGNSKLGRIPNISFRPITDCTNCAGCSHDCYALKAFKQYPTTRHAWTENALLWHNAPEQFERELSLYLHRRKPRRFRYFVAGDIPDRTFFRMMITLAERYPRTAFLAFTKNYAVLSTEPLPRNLSVRLSLWNGCAQPTDTLFKLYPFATVLGETPDGAKQCPGSCARCAFCWTNKTQPVNFKQH